MGDVRDPLPALALGLRAQLLAVPEPGVHLIQRRVDVGEQAAFRKGLILAARGSFDPSGDRRRPPGEPEAVEKQGRRGDAQDQRGCRGEYRQQPAHGPAVVVDHALADGIGKAHQAGPGLRTGVSAADKDAAAIFIGLLGKRRQLRRAVCLRPGCGLAVRERLASGCIEDLQTQAVFVQPLQTDIRHADRIALGFDPAGEIVRESVRPGGQTQTVGLGDGEYIVVQSHRRGRGQQQQRAEDHENPDKEFMLHGDSPFDSPVLSPCGYTAALPDPPPAFHAGAGCAP